MKASDPVLKYFKGIPSSLFTFEVPKIHHDSHLHNFKDMYREDNPEFWKDLDSLSKNLLSMGAKKVPKFIFLCGCPGSGKTHIVVGLYRAMVEKIGFAHGGGALFVTFPDMVADIISGFADDIPTRDALAEYTKNRWLFIDDFTASEKVFKQDSLEYQLFRDIILNRWDSDSVLVTSTNLVDPVLMKKLEEVFGDHLVSRLSDNTTLVFPYEDIRKEKSK